MFLDKFGAQFMGDETRVRILFALIIAIFGGIATFLSCIWKSTEEYLKIESVDEGIKKGGQSKETWNIIEENGDGTLLKKGSYYQNYQREKLTEAFIDVQEITMLRWVPKENRDLHVFVDLRYGQLAWQCQRNYKFRHVKTANNPADLAFRGTLSKDVSRLRQFNLGQSASDILDTSSKSIRQNLLRKLCKGCNRWNAITTRPKLCLEFIIFEQHNAKNFVLASKLIQKKGNEEQKPLKWQFIIPGALQQRGVYERMPNSLDEVYSLQWFPVGPWFDCECKNKEGIVIEWEL
ncbi:hypothetical protein DINM_003863 [Dirofilaria immitis]|nr:hypothetical protein [Dirofilaria immitis]